MDPSSPATPATEQVDARIIRTRESLRSAVLDLVSEHDWAEISITDLTRRAKISRPTFYLHYSSLDELAADALIERLRESASSTADLALIGDDMPGWLLAFLEDVNAHRATYRRLLTARSVAGIAQEMVAAKLVERITEGRVSTPDAEEVAQFLAGGILGFLAHWLRSDSLESPDSVSATAQRLWAMIRDIFPPTTSR
ncbi:TetR/AcrR family transcriptional regulator [Nocardia salmonicida]|uniref:TetR/AcrR family transcriptional regulator n=1 Tax=Nocardia salmonicida TaxID=53431 RepID=UPI00378CF08F